MPKKKKSKRPGWDEYFIGIAKAVSTRATCLRRKYGAVITKDNIIVSTGYNGESLWKKMIGKPYLRKLNVRFDEGKLKIGPQLLRQFPTLPFNLIGQ